MSEPPQVISGVYSNTGFDMISILSRLIHRPNPQIHLGPVDLSCSFVVSDARRLDCPVVYCSPGFEKLTGYHQSEIISRNCRFLQSPDGQVTGGSRRQHTDNQVVYYLKCQLDQYKEHQASIINYKKNAQPFVNLVTVVPLFDPTGQVEFFVGLQVDLVEQPNSILERMQNGTYLVNYNPPLLKQDIELIEDDYFQDTLPNPSPISQLAESNSNSSKKIDQKAQKEWNQLLLDQTVDFIFVLSLKGSFLYVSEGCAQLEYEPKELIGQSLSYLCHPSDLLPVMRALKEATDDVSVIFRVRRQRSGYTWVDCRGRLHMDPNKSRKYLVLCAREFGAYHLTYPQIQLHPKSFWAKLSWSGLYLYVAGCQPLVGYRPDHLVHESIYQYVGNEAIADISAALGALRDQAPQTVRHTLLTNKGEYVPVISTFYPADNTLYPTFVLLHIRPADEPVLSFSQKGNLFVELDTSRSTHWQYEVHQLALENQKLRDQIDSYTQPKKQRKKFKVKEEKICADCQTKDSPEWRKGPNGPKELCNACGLRFAKNSKK
ncbi:hypothetical protein BY458DRAFT_519971 [Sporodiniella umbellata]|nr:hypothetical protein BY458DRAFT_519971 [Sporodiniella umbellata]